MAQVYSGFCVDLLDAMVAFLNINITYTLINNPDGQLGNLLPDETWTGMLGDVVDLRADFSVGPAAVNYERSKEMDFTMPFFDIGIQILTKAPAVADLSHVWRFIQPFSAQVWLLLGGAVVFFAFTGFFFENRSPYGFSKSLDRHTRHLYGLGGWFIRSFMLFMVLGTTADMGRSWSTRMLVVSVFFAAIVFCSHYIAALTALFSLRSLVQPVSGIDQIRAEKIPFGVVAQQGPKDFIEDNIHAIWKQMVPQFIIFR